MNENTAKGNEPIYDSRNSEEPSGCSEHDRINHWCERALKAERELNEARAEILAIRRDKELALKVTSRSTLDYLAAKGGQAKEFS